MKTVSLQLYVVTILLLFSVNLSAQDLDSLMTLEAFTPESELQKDLNKDVSVSAVKLSSRESPGIVTVISSQDIVNSGARDLTDVLKFVPGFDVLQDLQFVQGLGLRGSWANEGKVLILFDGIPMNDLLYQVFAVGNRFPAEAIERIEIIRGPGSAVYGGSAEYGVINIISKAAGTNGFSAFYTTGIHSNGIGRMNFGLSASQKKENFSWFLNAYRGKGNTSNQTFESPDGTYDLRTTTEQDPMNIGGGLSYKGLDVKFMYDEYKTGDQYSNISFKAGSLAAQYQIKVNQKFTLTPKILYINQLPWYIDENKGKSAIEPPIFDFRATRTQGQLDAAYDPSRKVSVNFGAIYFQDESHDRQLNEHVLTLDNFAFYAQGLFKHRLANTTIGFRYEKNNLYSGAFVPRIAITKKIEDFHFKLLYSKSFRSPSLQNFSLALVDMKPEKSNVFEIELGYQFTPEMLLAVNAYHISTKDVIIYGSEGDGDDFNEWYENYAKSGSKGLEVVYSLKKKRWYGQVTYTLQETIDGNTVEKFVVPQTSKQYAGMPHQKVTFNLNYALTNRFNLNTSLIQVGARYAYTDVDDNGPIASKLSPYTQWNFFLNCKVVKNFSAGVGVFDILNAKPAVPQAYNGGVNGLYPPIPGRTREFILKLSYQFNR